VTSVNRSAVRLMAAGRLVIGLTIVTSAIDNSFLSDYLAGISVRATLREPERWGRGPAPGASTAPIHGGSVGGWLDILDGHRIRSPESACR
jgi:hypothetical protein